MAAPLRRHAKRDESARWGAEAMTEMDNGDAPMRDPPAALSRIPVGTARRPADARGRWHRVAIPGSRRGRRCLQPTGRRQAATGRCHFHPGRKEPNSVWSSWGTCQSRPPGCIAW